MDAINYKLLIQYDGTDFSGWQIQKNADSVQQRVKEAIETVTRQEITLTGSGRTDSGVHALGQTANFFSAHDLNIYRTIQGINALLPDSIAVTSLEKTSPDFNARFSAKKRSYIYFFSEKKSPFYQRYSWRWPQIESVDISRLNELSNIFRKKEDFTSFAKKNSDTPNKVCEITDIWWRKSGDLTIFYIQADRFLHGMVRAIVGTLIFAARKNLDKDYISEIIEARDREKAAMSAPAKGLFLYKVRY